MISNSSDIASAVLGATGASAILIWNPAGDWISSPGWHVAASDVERLRTAVVAEPAPRNLAAGSDALGGLDARAPGSCVRFHLMAAGEEEAGAGVLLGYAENSATVDDARLPGLADLALMAAEPVLADVNRELVDRFTTLSEIVSGLGHDIGTPLNVISGYAESILMGTADDAPGRKQISSIVEQTRRIARMIHMMLDIVRPLPDHATTATTVGQFASEVFQISSFMPRKRDIRCRVGPDTSQNASVTGDLPQLRHALFGLLRAVACAAGPKGQVTIRAVADEALGTGLLFDVADAAGRPANLTALGRPDIWGGESGYVGLALAARVLAQHGGGFEIVRPEPESATGGVFVRIGSSDAGTKHSGFEEG